MRILEIAVAMLLVASNAGAFSEIDVKKLLAVNVCVSCDLSGADLREANLVKANLRYANLRGADLSKANLKKADFFNADLRGANLRGVKMSGAYCSGADLSGAVLWNANTKGAIFCKTKTPWGVDNSGCKKAK